MQNKQAPKPGFSVLDGLLLGLVVVWGINFSVLKVGLDAMPPQVFNALRMALAGVVFGGLLLAQRRWRWAPGDGRRIAGLGLVGHAGYQVLFIEGLARTTAGTAALILASVPLWVAVLGAVLGLERVRPRAWLGIALAFIGVLVVILGSNPILHLPGSGTGDGGPELLGDGLVLVATWCWAAYTALSQPLLTRYSPTQLNGWTLIAALPALLGVALVSGLVQGWGTLTLAAGGAALYGGLLAINVCYVIWYAGVQRLGGARTAVYSNLTPLVAVGAAWLWRGEPLRPVYLLGALLIGGGLLLARFATPATPAATALAAEAESAVGTG